MPRQKYVPPPESFLFYPAGFSPGDYPGPIGRHFDAAVFVLSSIYILNLICFRDRREYVGLHSKILETVMGGGNIYCQVMGQLREADLIERTPGYTVDEAPYGYRLGKAARFSSWEKRPPANKRVAKRVEAFKAYLKTPAESREPIVNHLHGWMDRVGFTTQLEATIEALPDVRYDPMAEFATKKELARHQVDLFQGGLTRMSRCKYGRVHSNLTSACGEIRQCLQIDGEALHEIDVKNSQPYFLTCLACDWTGPTEGQRETNHPDQGTGPYVLRSVPSPGLMETFWICAEGRFYDRLMAEDDWSRGEVKENLIRVIFGRPYQMIDEIGGEWLKDAYPDLWRVAMDLKLKYGHEHVGRTLQRMESGVLIDGACEWLRKHRPEVPLVTCHDSVATTERHLETVIDVLKRSFDDFPACPKFEIKLPRK